MADLVAQPAQLREGDRRCGACRGKLRARLIWLRRCAENAPLLDQARERQRTHGIAIPATIDPGPPPPVHPELLWYLDAYAALATCRPQIVGFVPGPDGTPTLATRPGAIPWTAIRAYGIARELAPDVLEAFEQVIAELEAADHRDQAARAAGLPPPTDAKDDPPGNARNRRRRR